MEEKRRAHPERNDELWCQDQHRVGEKPILRGMWAKKGQRPVVIQKRGYHWLYLYTFVHPKSGRNESFLMPTVSADLFSQVLAWFARLVGAGRERWILLLVDRAGWHTSPKVVLPEGLELVFLPPCSPELQPTETLWALYDEVLANRFWSSLQQIEPVLAERCCWLADQTPLVARRTSFHWLPT